MARTGTPDDEGLTRQLDALAEITRELLAEHDPDRLCLLIVTHAQTLFGANCGIYDADRGGTLLPRVDTDVTAMQRRLAVGEGVAGECALMRRGVLVNDYPRWPQAIPWAVAHGLQHVMAEPLVIRDHLLGVMVVSRQGAEAPPFSDDDLSVLRRFAALAALVIRNAELYAERQRADATVRDSERRYRLLAENMADVVTLLDMNFRPLYVSPSVLRLRGYTSEEAMAQSSLERFTPASAAVAAQSLAEELELEASGQADSRRGRTVELELTCKDGSTVWVESRTSFVRDTDGRPIGILSVARNISERKRSEQTLRERDEQLRQAQKMEAVGRLAGGIAHDFNNILSVVGGRAEILLRQLPPGAPARRGTELIQQAAERGARLTAQLLAFSRKQVLQRSVLDPAVVIRNMVPMIRRLIGEHIEIRLSESAELPHLYADPGQLEQILINLAVNARDAMPHGGRLAIDLARIVVSPAASAQHPGTLPGVYVALTVSDSGIGMAADTREHLFEPFFTTKDVGKGTGLGLSTVYGIVRQNGGFIEVESEPGAGASFRIYLPVAGDGDAVAEAPVDAGLDTLPRGSESLLVVEDDADLLEMAREVLTGLGYQVHVAQNAAEALDAVDAREAPVDLLFTDVVMPGVRGDALADLLLKTRRVHRVLFTSGYPGEADLSGSAFLQKPYSASALARTVRDVLDGPAPRAR